MGFESFVLTEGLWWNLLFDFGFEAYTTYCAFIHSVARSDEEMAEFTH